MAPSIPQRDDPTALVRAGGCTDPTCVHSLAKVSFVNQSATRDPRKAFHTPLVSLESPFSPERQNLTCSHVGNYLMWVIENYITTFSTAI